METIETKIDTEFREFKKIYDKFELCKETTIILDKMKEMKNLLYIYMKEKKALWPVVDLKRDILYMQRFRYCQILCFLCFFTLLYIDKEQIAGSKNGHATRKFPGIIVSVKALLLILCKEDTPKLYKNKFETESDEWCFNG